MARTRSAKDSVANAIKSEPSQNDESPDQQQGSDEEVATSDQMVPSAFKATLDRFRHNEPENQTPEVESESQNYKKGRKRPLPSVIKPEDPNSAVTTTTTSPPRPPKRRRLPSKYAPPSKYAHLPPLLDVLSPNLICIFVGTNPGLRTATSGHAYAHPSNLFWKLLHSSGCTDVRLNPSQDVDLPRLYSLGNTNIVERPSRDAAELSKAEMAEGTPGLEAKVRKYRPEAVCIVGKGIWEAVWRWRYQRGLGKGEFRYGWQEERERMGRCEEWEGARVFVATSTSGLSASTKPAEKEAIWRPFGEWVMARRKEREVEVEGVGKEEEEVKEEPVSEEPVG
jgi:mismatch-specific thymine-DNA glycosylase